MHITIADKARKNTTHKERKDKQSSWQNNHSANIKYYTQNNIKNTIYHSHE